MPGVAQYEADPQSKPAGDLDRLAGVERDARKQVIERNWKYFEGKHRHWLKRDKSGVDDNVTMNKIDLIIKKSLSSLIGVAEKGVVHGPEMIAVDKSTQHALDLIWTANLKDILLFKLALSGALSGHCYLRLMPNQKDNPESLVRELPRIMLLQPADVTVFWDMTDVERVLWYRIEHAFGDRLVKRQDIVYQPNTKSLVFNKNTSDPVYVAGDYWLIRELESKSGVQGGVFRVIRETIWPRAWAPIVDWQNSPTSDGYYGLDEVGELGALNDSLNFVASNVQRIIKQYAKPKTIATGVEVTTDGSGGLKDTGIEDLYSIAAPDAKVYNIETYGNLASSLEFMVKLQRAIFDGASELDPESIQANLGAMTNFGIRILYRDNLEKSSIKRLVYTDGLQRTCVRALELVGIENADVSVDWPPPLPTDPVLQVQALAVDVQHGVSNESYQEQRGYNPLLEAKRKAEEQARSQSQQQQQSQDQSTQPNLPASPASITAKAMNNS